MLTHPKIPAEDCVFREQFINPAYITDNGGEVSAGNLSGADNRLAFSDDIVIDYADSRANEAIKSGVFSVRIAGVLSNVGTDGGAIFGWYVDANNRIYIEIPRNGNAGWRIVYDINGVGVATSTGVDLSNGYNEIVVTFNGATWSAYLNGSPTSLSASVDLAGLVGDSDIYIGGVSPGLVAADGVFCVVEVYDRVLTAGEVADRFTRNTFREIDASEAIMWLPCKAHYNDGSSQVTDNIGALGGTVDVGDGSTASLFPAITGKGFEYDGADDYLRYDNGGIDNLWATGGSVSFMVKPYSDGEGDFGKIFDKANATGWELQVQDDSGTAVNMKLNVDFDGGAGAGWTTSSRWLNLNRWNSVVVVYNGSNTTNDPIFYINGVAHTVGDGITETLPPVGTIEPDNGVMSVVTIGRDYTGSRTFDGTIDVPAFWNFELTTTQAKYMHDYMFRNLNIQ